MPTFDNPAADAIEASESLRGLAHATRTFDDPADLYSVLGDLLGGVRSLQQVLEQLAVAHDRHRARARDDDGDVQAGARFVFTASSELFDAARTLDQVEMALNVASQASGRIAWQPAKEGPDRRCVSVVFLQGEEADQALQMLRGDGPTATIDHLAQWDYGDQTTQAALSNGYVYEAPPVTQFDEFHFADPYSLIANPSHRYVSLLRSSVPEPETPSKATSLRGTSAAIAAEAATPEHRSSRTLRLPADGISSVRRERAQGSWFEHPGIAEVKRLRGLEL